MMDYFNEIFTAYKTRNRRAGEISFRDMEWSRHCKSAHSLGLLQQNRCTDLKLRRSDVRPGELGFPTNARDRMTRYEWVRQWAHLHARVRVVGVWDTVGSIGMSGWRPQPGEDVDWHATRLHPSKPCNALLSLDGCVTDPSDRD
jgi:hypothetical protein